MRALDHVRDWPVERVAVGVTTARATVDTRGGHEDVLRWASITKLVTALTALMAVEQAVVDLDEPAGPEGSTVRHLLAHASGLPFEGEAPIAPPGRRRIYSNTGYEVLGRLLADRTRLPFAELVRENVLAPLGMDATELTGTPAAGLEGPLDDLLRLGRELLAPSLVGDELFATATSVVFPGLSGVLPGIGRMDPMDWGLGFELRDGKDPHWTGSRNSPATFGHFGGSGSFLWVDPGAGLACGGLSDREFGEWALESWPALADAILAEA